MSNPSLIETSPLTQALRRSRHRSAARRREDQSALVGAVLNGPYRLTRLIRGGGMGAVYEAQQLTLKKRVAVKMLIRELASDREAVARFRQEAEVTSRIGHPHVVHVFDFGVAPWGVPYLVMEYLDGEDLDQRLGRVGRLSVASMVHVVAQVASALTAAHAHGVVHRDLKPANLFVLKAAGKTDFIKVVDFGISKVVAAATRLTGPAEVLGTPSYMAPEQATGQIDDIDHRTDQWAVACIAHELVSGRAPFAGENVASLLYQVIHQEPPPLADRVLGVSPAVEAVLRRALSKRQADRWPSMAAFSRALLAAFRAPASATQAGDPGAPLISLAK